MSSPSLRPLIDTCQKCSTSPANHEPRSPANGGFQNPGVCPQAVSSFPSPTPTVFFLGSRPIFRAGKIPKTPFLGCSSVFLCSQTLRKRLLRRLIFSYPFLSYLSTSIYYIAVFVNLICFRIYLFFFLFNVVSVYFLFFLLLIILARIE